MILATGGPSRVIDGILTQSSVTFTVGNVVSVCEAGGKPLAPLVLWGFDDAVTQASVGLPYEVPRDGFLPLPDRAVIRVDSFPSESLYVRTLVSTRRVLDPQRPWVNPLNGVASRGLAATMVLADVYGRCLFGHRVEVGTVPLWVPTDGNPSLVVTVTDETTQTTTALTCTLEPDCPITVIVGPGGVRWR